MSLLICLDCILGNLSELCFRIKMVVGAQSMAIKQPHGEVENGIARSLSLGVGCGAKGASIIQTEVYYLHCLDLSWRLNK